MDLDPRRLTFRVENAETHLTRHFESVRRIDLVGPVTFPDHDAILRGGSIPVEMVRARLVNAPLTRDHRPSWKYYGAEPLRGR